MIKKGDLVRFDCPHTDDTVLTGLVCRDPYVTVFSNVHEKTQRTISSSESIVVDILSQGTIYKKIIVDNIEKTG